MNEPAETSVRMDGENLVYTVDEALASVGFGKFQRLVLVYAGLALFADAMEVMILSFVGPAVKSQWDLSSSQESLLSTAVFGGRFIGSFFWGLVSDLHGRRQAIISPLIPCINYMLMGFLGATLLTCGAGLLSAFSPNYASLVILRCLVGSGLGGGSVFSSWFLEFVPASHRGKRMLLLSWFWAFGSIFEAFLAWLVMPRLGWRWLLAASCLPAFALLLFYSHVPESPRYLCMKGRINDAYNILEKIALLNQSQLPPGELVPDSTIGLDEESATSEYTPLLSTTEKMDLDFRSGFQSFLMLFSSKLIRTTLLLWELLFGNVFSYYGIILMTSELSSGQSRCGSNLLKSENPESLYINVFISNLAELPGIVLSATIVDRIGRKLTVAVTFILAGIFLLPLVYHQSATLTMSFLFGARMSTKAALSVATIYGHELYPTSVRATGAGAANAAGKVGGMICPLVAVGLVTSCQITEAIILFENVHLLFWNPFLTTLVLSVLVAYFSC
nr:organic cation/carnitine transporter 7-like [Populus alba]